MSRLTEDLLNPALLAMPLYLVTMFWERRVLSLRRAAGQDVLGYERRDTIASLLFGALSILSVGVLNAMLRGVADWLWQYRITDLGTGLTGWAVALLGWDFMYYWLHRAEHETRFLWATHVSHHSSVYYNLSTALRQPWLPIAIVAFFPPLALLGVRPWMIMISGGFNLVYQYWIHTEAIDRLPSWFELLFNTPSHHRVHHGSQPQYLDKNHGGVLIIWDRIFGTFASEQERVQYGLTKNIQTYSLWKIFNHEVSAIAQDVAKARTRTEQLGYIFRGPGWEPPRSEASTKLVHKSAPTA